MSVLKLQMNFGNTHASECGNILVSVRKINPQSSAHFLRMYKLGQAIIKVFFFYSSPFEKHVGGNQRS